ncbi:hypothetical protein [Henriciella marina]|nr:hypothetical protein [Henriciella marina]
MAPQDETIDDLNAAITAQ